jgi:hypothetical protein
MKGVEQQPRGPVDQRAMRREITGATGIRL